VNINVKSIIDNNIFKLQIDCYSCLIMIIGYNKPIVNDFNNDYNVSLWEIVINLSTHQVKYIWSYKNVTVLYGLKCNYCNYPD